IRDPGGEQLCDRGVGGREYVRQQRPAPAEQLELRLPAAVDHVLTEQLLPAGETTPRHGRRPSRSTSASTRVGLPEPPTIGSGPAKSTAPCGGSWARFCNCVSPYLPAPWRYQWQG